MVLSYQMPPPGAVTPSAFSILAMCARAVAGGVVGEDAADDGRLGRIDFAQAALGFSIGPEADHLSIAVMRITLR